MPDRVHILVGLLVLGVAGLAPISGCRGLDRIDNPKGWPQTWSGRALRSTPNAWYYARSAGATGLVDDEVTRASETFRETVRREPPRGLVVLKGRSDHDLELASKALFVVEFESDEARQEVLSIVGKSESQLNESLGPVAELMGAVYTGRRRTELSGLPSQAAIDASWIVVVPTEKRARQLVEELVDTQIKKADINPLLTFFAGPFIKQAQEEMIRQLRFFQQMRVLEAMLISDDALDEAERVRLLKLLIESSGPENPADVLPSQTELGA